MQMTITVEIDESYIHEYLLEHSTKTRADAIGDIGNVLYMGCSAIDAMMDRALEIPSTSWVESEPAKEFEYNDHFPTNEDFPITQIIQRAILNEIDWDKKTIDFARQCWAECAIKHNIKTGK